MTELDAIVGAFIDDEGVEAGTERDVLAQEVSWLLSIDARGRTWEGPANFERLRLAEENSMRDSIAMACGLAHEDALTISEWMCAAMQDGREATT